MSQADTYSQYLHEQIGEPYVWGDEGPGTHDCSGLYWEGMHQAGVLWRSHPFPRMTANDYYHMGTTIARPEYVGADAGYIVTKSGKAVHIIPYVGLGYTIEARGRKWGVVKYALDDPINGAYRRKAKWRRLPVNLGELTEEDMNDEQNTWLKELRQLVATQSSYREAIAVAQNAGLYNEVKRLNDEFYVKWPTGVTGLPKGWKP
jgi:hypothetical protein